MRRLLPGIAAAAGLLALLVAAPWALYSWGRVGLLGGIDWAHAFTVPDDGRLMLGFLSLIGWVAWLVLAVSIVVEIVEVVDRLRAGRTRRPHRPLALPGLDLPRLLVRGLVVTAATTVLGLGLPRIAPPAVAQSVEVTVPRDAVPVQAVALDRGPAVVTTTGTMVPSSRIATEPMPVASLYVVQPGEDVRSLATRFYGDARQWPRIADANPDLISDPDALKVGWRLVIPGVASPDGTSVIIVARGDSLSKLAARYLGDGDRWPEIFAINRDLIKDPNLIYKSWRLKLPGAGPAAQAPAATVKTEATAPPSVHPVLPDEPGVASRVVPVQPTETASAETAPAESAVDELDAAAAESLSASQALALGVVGTVGAGLAAAVVRTIRRRRDVQLALRPLNRRILFPPATTMAVESALAVVGFTATPIQEPEPSVDAARAVLYRPRHAVVDTAWATVTAGFTSEGPVLLDLETHRLVTLDLGDEETTWGTACAWALELACGTGAGGDTEGATIVAVGPIGDALAAAALDSIVCVPTARAAIDELVATVAQQRAQLEASGWGLREARLDDDAHGAWWPRVYVFGAIDNESMRRLEWALGGAKDTAVSAIIVRDESDSAASTRLGARFTGTAALALLEPDDVTVRPASLSAGGVTGVVNLLGTSGSSHTVPAPWYDFEGKPDNVLSFPTLAGSMKEVVDVGDDSPGVTDFSHPTLMLLGPIQLLGAAGPPPVRAERSCIEYCAWMVEHPGATASQMAAALLVAEGTRRSNVSRLRGWLGTAGDATPYLPEAYTGRLYLDPLVSSDWQRLSALISPGINRVPVPTLVSALKLVRGAPLADAAPGQWHWAEELRADMVSTIRDIGARVGDAALADGDIDLARWAAGRALVAAPGDEILMRLRLRTEHRAGNRPDVERIVLQLTRHARVLGIDLDDETVRAIQEAIEGQPRARA
jgi:LysM repeat protein